MSLFLPEGVLVGSWSDLDSWTGCTVVLAPEGSAVACEVTGGGPGTRESDLLAPQASASGVNAIILSGGSAFGLAAADGVVGYLAERGIGYRTRAGLVPSSRVRSSSISRSAARPFGRGQRRDTRPARRPGGRLRVDPSGSARAAPWARSWAPGAWTKGGLGFAGRTIAGGGKVAALAAVNAFGEVLAEDGSILAGVWQDGAYRRTVDLLAGGASLDPGLARGDHSGLRADGCGALEDRSVAGCARDRRRGRS